MHKKIENNKIDKVVDCLVILTYRKIVAEGQLPYDLPNSYLKNSTKKLPVICCFYDNYCCTVFLCIF